MTSPQAGPEGTPALRDSSVTGTGRARTRAVPEATVARLAVYLRMLGELVERGTETVSSDELAAVCGVNSAKLRKDLSYVGSHGIRGVGYEVGPLLRHLESALGLTIGLALAIDFANCSTRSTACYRWLSGNAAGFGFYNLPSEPWHWSINGN